MDVVADLCDELPRNRPVWEVPDLGGVLGHGQLAKLSPNAHHLRP